MKLIVFGATGKTGQHVWQNALGRGHDVAAFTRSPHKLERSAGLRIAQGDVTDAASVAAAVAGHDAVIVALGGQQRPARPDDPDHGDEDDHGRHDEARCSRGIAAT